MKKIMMYKFLLLSGLVGFMSCETDENLQPEGQWSLSEPNILDPTSEEVIVLDETTPNETITFNWEEAESSAGYNVTYEVLIDTLDSADFSTPIFSEESSNNGEEASLSISYQEINEALALSGFEPGTEASVSFAVRANSLSKSSQSVSELKVVRFESEILPTKLFISGTATENNNNLSEAIELKRLNQDNDSPSNTYEIYTSLVEGESYKFYSKQSLPAIQYGGSEGNLVSFGDSIVAENSGEFRIRVDLDNNTYELFQIEFWSMVGTPIQGSWNGDEPLEYQGNSTWEASINLINTGGFAFRANADWNYLLKRIVGTPNKLVLESDAADQGFTVEDIPSNQTGLYIVTLNLSADAYTYSFEEDDTVIEPIDTPQQLFLFENGTMIEEFNKDGDVFSSERLISMQASNDYSLNSAIDGSGISYSVNGSLADSTTPDEDNVSDVITLLENDNTFTLTNDRGLRLSIDFSVPQLSWTYYNFKLFHWDVWEDRTENLMTYSHPNTYTITMDLTAGYESKFISPWDYDLGSDAPSSLTGNLINGGGSNLMNINTDGTYEVIMILDDDYETGTYEFNEQ